MSRAAMIVAGVAAGVQPARSRDLDGHRDPLAHSRHRAGEPAAGGARTAPVAVAARAKRLGRGDHAVRDHAGVCDFRAVGRRRRSRAHSRDRLCDGLDPDRRVDCRRGAKPVADHAPRTPVAASVGPDRREPRRRPSRVCDSVPVSHGGAGRRVRAEADRGTHRRRCVHARRDRLHRRARARPLRRARQPEALDHGVAARRAALDADP